MNAKDFLAQKGVYNLDTKKRYNEVIAWMEEYVALHQPPVIKSVCINCGKPIEQHSKATELCPDRFAHFEQTVL